MRLSLNKKEAKEEEFNFYGCIMTIMSIHRAYMGVLLKYNAAGRDFTTKSKHLHISLVRANVLQWWNALNTNFSFFVNYGRNILEKYVEYLERPCAKECTSDKQLTIIILCSLCHSLSIEMIILDFISLFLYIWNT